jgi:coenzyme F420-reducing hydrogenase beta subunit
MHWVKAHKHDILKARQIHSGDQLLDFINRKQDCTGCGACLNACPNGAITMYMDEEGFFYPQQNGSCIHCDKCRNVCPLGCCGAPVCHTALQHACAAVSKDNSIWKASTSGGAFTEICRAFGDDNTVIFGAAFDGLQAMHRYVIGSDQMHVFRKSKYVQSDTGLCYRSILAFLEENKNVVFSGTPCQVAGLRNYLERDYDHLLCIDLICHGVGSPAVFKAFLCYLETKYGSRLHSYTFRVKNIFLGNFALYVSRYEFENGKTIFMETDEYTRLFLQQLCLRPSCAENCQFRTSERSGDLTIGDFKRRDEVFPDVADYRNYSTIVVNSEKGDRVLRSLDKTMKILPCELEHVKKFNPLFYSTTKGNPLREDFFKDFSNGMDFHDLVQIYTAPPMGMRWADRMKRMLPYEFKTLVRRIRSKQRQGWS